MIMRCNAREYISQIYGTCYYHIITPVKNIQHRSSSSDLPLVHKGNTNIGIWTFSVAAPTFWNVLSSSVRSVEHIAKSRRMLL